MNNSTEIAWLARLWDLGDSSSREHVLDERFPDATNRESLRIGVALQPADEPRILPDHAIRKPRSKRLEHESMFLGIVHRWGSECMWST